MTDLRFVSLGFGNICQANEIWAVMRIGSAQSRRIIADAKADDRFFDWTGKRAMKSIILLKNGMVCSSPFAAATLYKRLKDVTVPPVIVEAPRMGNTLETYKEIEYTPSDVDEEEDMVQEEIDDGEARLEDSDESDFEEEDDDEDEDDL